MDVPVLRALAVDAGGSILILQVFARRSSEAMNDQLWSDSKFSISGLPSIEFVTLRQDITWHASSSGTRTILVRISTRNVLGIMSPISLNGYNRFRVANCFTRFAKRTCFVFMCVTTALEVLRQRLKTLSGASSALGVDVALVWARSYLGWYLSLTKCYLVACILACICIEYASGMCFYKHTPNAMV